MKLEKLKRYKKKKSFVSFIASWVFKFDFQLSCIVLYIPAWSQVNKVIIDRAWRVGRRSKTEE